MRRILALMLCLMTIFAPLAARAASVEDAFLAWLSADAAFVAAEDTQTGQTHTYAAGGGHWTLQLDAAGQALSLRSEAESAESALLSRAEAEAALKLSTWPHSCCARRKETARRSCGLSARPPQAGECSTQQAVSPPVLSPSGNS